MTDSGLGIFESFNARFVDAKQVGSTFVLSPFLEKAIAGENTAVLGPRGSGKTTLLKMLTVPALLNWSAPQRDQIAEGLSHLAVYVPYSLTWSADYRGFSQKPLSTEIDELLSISLFRHSVLLAFLDTWKQCSRIDLNHASVLAKFRLPIDPKAEAHLARHLSRLWELDIPISTVNGIKEGIARRVRHIQRLSVTANRSEVAAATLLERDAFLADHFLDDAAQFANFLNEHYGFNSRISLCFDELEIASDAIANAVLRAPRSIDQRFLVKFSAAPYVGAATALSGANVATQKNDFELLFLSSFSPSDTRDFSESLFGAIAKKHKAESDDPDIVLGSSVVDDVSTLRTQRSESGKSRYSADGTYQRKFERLFQIDNSFRVFSTGAGLDVTDLSKGTENLRAASIRKIIWPVLVREEFLFKQEGVDPAEGQRRRLRSKDPVSDIYTGAGSLFAICEGNPRALIGVLEPMIKAFVEGDVASNGSVRRSMQKRVLDSLISSYFALLSTVPNSGNARGLSSLLDLVYSIGEYFRESVLGERFNPDPVLSFYVDDGISSPMRALIGKGVNIGAFVTANEASLSAGNVFKVGDIGGLKIRLSNIFAPRFRLPLAGGRTINLSTILHRSRRGSSDPVLELFGEKI
jgi:hypothetical protein